MNYYALEIRHKNKNSTISDILGLEVDTDFDNEESLVWRHTVEERIDEPFFDFINLFLDRLEQNQKKLREFKIDPIEISIWHLYEYEQQCNLEYSPKDLMRMGKFGVTLCISCWAK